MDGGFWPDAGRLAMIHALHRVVAAVVGVFVLCVLVYGWRMMRWHAPLTWSSCALIVLFVAQIFVGATNIWTLLKPAAAAAHLALAAAIWALLVAQAGWAHRAAIADWDQTVRRRQMRGMRADVVGAGGS
jgi:heme A synthase